MKAIKPSMQWRIDKQIVGRTTLAAIGARVLWRDFRVVAFMMALLVIALLLTGCATDGGRKPPSQVPPMPPKPTTAATAGAIDSAATNAIGAQTSVRSGRDLAKRDEGVAAVPHLERADAQLDTTLADLASAKSHATELQTKIDSDRREFVDRENAFKKSIAAADAANKKLAAEIVKLNNEVQRTAWRWMVGIGTLCLALAAAATVAFFFSVFPAGLKVGPPLAAMGGMCLAVATMLSKIILAAQISVGLGFVFVLAYAGWHLWTSHRDTLSNVVAGVQFAKKNMTPEAVAALGEQLSAATSNDDKSLIASIKQKLGLPS